MKYYLTLSLFFFHLLSMAQENIYPDKDDSELQALLKSNYAPSAVLSYNNARDQLWGALATYNDDSLHAVYTNLTVYISPSASNPRTVAYNQGIDCEHSWPQSLGAYDDAKSDMHHLYPTRTQANSARGNLPFNEIDDNITDKWFYKTSILSSIPTTYINAYSELDENKAFEPREDHKGNVARAMFYFYTIYPGQADQAFFMKQMDILYQWHYMDPVDDEEIWRNNFIASKQGNKNPFILDSTLIRRAYFPEYGHSSTPEKDKSNMPEIYPNPGTGQLNIRYDEFKETILLITDIHGRKLLETDLKEDTTRVDVSALLNGIYFLYFCNDREHILVKWLKI